MRSPLWFVVAGLIALAGLAGALFYLLPRVAVADAGMTRVVVPGSAVIVLDRPGHYTIFHETKSTVDGRYYASDTVDGLSLGLTAEATGVPVKLAEPSTSTSYTIGNRSGTSIYAFTVEQPGRYRLTAHLASGRGDPKAVLAIGLGILRDMFGLIFSAIGISFAGFGVAGAIVLMVLWQRSKAPADSATATPP